MSLEPLPDTRDPVLADRAAVRVLVVEDDLDHRMLMTRRLQRDGMVVTSAADAEQALDRLAGVDLVLLDYRLPTRSGIEVLDEIRGLDRPPSVVMVTGTESVDVAVDAMRAGAIDFVVKHAGYLDALPEVVRRAFRHHDLTRRAEELQRLALLVSSVEDRDRLFREIVAGAGRLLRADAGVLLLLRDERLETATVLGEPGDDLADVQRDAVARLQSRPDPRMEGDRLLVPLPRDGGRPVGLLVLWPEGWGGSDEEVALAQTFASFAGIALANMRQRELRWRLVAELQQTVDARRDFVSSVSHELRTPLTSISGFAATLRDSWQELPAELCQDLLARVDRNARALGSLIEELMELAALDEGRTFEVAVRPVDLHDVVERAVADAAPILADRPVDVDVDHRDAVLADPNLLRRTLGQLLSNAVKFSEAGSAVAVRGHVEGERMLVEVVDAGIGLDPHRAARVFDPFFRAEGSVGNAVPGSGIGLALVREYVRTMGGEVGVRSEPGRGSTFWFTLPTCEVTTSVPAGR